MSTSQITSQSQPYAGQHCARCGIVLPPTAIFCGKCGERLERLDQHTKGIFSIDRHVSLENYRITALMRRAPYVQLSLAIDTQHQRPVAIRDIDIQQIDHSLRPHIFKELQQEYDLLRQQKSNDILPLIASFHANNHLYSISAWPLTAGTSPVATGGTTTSKQGTPYIYTLQDLLQSGIGLPDEQTALNWILRLAKAVEHLHSNHIVIGTLDPSTILVNQKDYSGQPTLFSSWMLPAVQSQMQQVLNTANVSPLSYITADRTAFFSPETRQGRPEMRSDIYSMGALLYLLMTGIAPTEQSRTTTRQFRSPREINPRVQHTLATTILKMLSGEPSARFKSVNEFIAVLLEQQSQSKSFQRLSNISLGQNRSVEKAGIQRTETNITSDNDNNKTEQGKAGQTRLETNDDAISLAPIPQQSARHYLSRIRMHKPGQEPPNSEHEESMLETGYSENTMQRTKEIAQQPQGENLAPVVEVVSGQEDGISSSNTSDNTALACQDELTHGQGQALPLRDEDGQALPLRDEDEQALPLRDEDEQALPLRDEDEQALPLRDEDEQALPLRDEDEQNTQTLNENRAVSSESHEQIRLGKQPPPDSSATEGSIDSENTSSSESENLVLSLAPLLPEILQRDKKGLTARTRTFAGLFEHIKRFVLGGQPRTTNAVAMIETPMRIQPNTNYTIRIHITGRNEPKHASGFKQSNNGAVLGGLGSLIHGERLHIEVRSALYHNYAYIVQQTDVEVPAANYAAEITIPMCSITDNTGTKRERLHIFFTDQKHRPLYEKPFVIELFISNLVQSGNEGYNVLSIPL